MKSKAFMKRLADKEPEAFRAVIAIHKAGEPDTLEFHRAASLGLASFSIIDGAYSLSRQGEAVASYGVATQLEVSCVS